MRTETENAVNTTGQLIKTFFDSQVMYCLAEINEASGGTKNALEALKEIQYNNFDGAKVSEWLGKLLEGKNSVKVSVGREYSPIVYVTVLNWNDKEGRRRTESEKIKMALRIQREGKSLKADETGIERLCAFPAEDGTDNYRVRLWWD